MRGDIDFGKGLFTRSTVEHDVRSLDIRLRSGERGGALLRGTHAVQKHLDGQEPSIDRYEDQQLKRERHPHRRE